MSGKTPICPKDEVRFFGTDGSLSRIIRLSETPPALADHHMDAWLNAMAGENADADGGYQGRLELQATLRVVAVTDGKLLGIDPGCPGRGAGTGVECDSRVMGWPTRLLRVCFSSATLRFIPSPLPVR